MSMAIAPPRRRSPLPSLTSNNMSAGAYNPFTDLPVPPRLFVGRTAEVAAIARAVKDSLAGQFRPVTVIGDPGMGKTSLGDYIRSLPAQIASTGIHPPVIVKVSLGGCRSTMDACVQILDSIREASQPIPLFDRFKNHLATLKEFGLDLGPVGFKIARDDSMTPNKLILQFDRVVMELAGALPEEYGGLFLILDELDSISGAEGFASFLKTLVESFDGRNRSGARHIGLMLLLNPAHRDRLEAGHATVLRGHTLLEIKPLMLDECAALIETALGVGSPRKKVSAGFASFVHYWTSGVPSFIHATCRAAFDVDQDQLLDEEDFRNGVLGTPEVVGAIADLELKHFRKRYQQDILSNRYRRILHAIASHKGDEVTPKQIRDKLTSTKEHDGLVVYLRNMVDREVLKKSPGQVGRYTLPDRMFKVFLRLEEIRKSRPKS